MSSIEPTKNGYRVRYRDRSGRSRSRSFKRKLDAKNFKSSVDEGVDVDKGRIYLEDFLLVYRDNHLRVTKPNDYDYKDLVKHLVPIIGSVPLNKITKEDLFKVRRHSKEQYGVSSRTINKVMSLTRTMFDHALDWNYLPKNPCVGIKQLKHMKSEHRFWTKDEMNRFLSYAIASDKMLHDVVLFLTNMGTRFGEMQALQRDCVDLDRGEVIIKRRWSRDKGTTEDITKGRKSRRIPMNSRVLTMMKTRSMVPMNHLIFPGLDNTNFRKRRYQPAIESCGVSDIRLHDLRHTFGSHLAMDGVPVVVIQELMGHVDIKTTMAYMHLSPGTLDGVTESLCVKSVSSKSGCGLNQDVSG